MKRKSIWAILVATLLLLLGAYLLYDRKLPIRIDVVESQLQLGEDIFAKLIRATSELSVEVRADLKAGKYILAAADGGLEVSIPEDTIATLKLSAKPKIESGNKLALLGSINNGSLRFSKGVGVRKDKLGASVETVELGQTKQEADITLIFGESVVNLVLAQLLSTGAAFGSDKAVSPSALLGSLNVISARWDVSSDPLLHLPGQVEIKNLQLRTDGGEIGSGSLPHLKIAVPITSIQQFLNSQEDLKVIRIPNSGSGNNRTENGRFERRENLTLAWNGHDILYRTSGQFKIRVIFQVVFVGTVDPVVDLNVAGHCSIERRGATLGDFSIVLHHQLTELTKTRVVVPGDILGIAAGIAGGKFDEHRPTAFAAAKRDFTLAPSLDKQTQSILTKVKLQEFNLNTIGTDLVLTASMSYSRK